jgi:hypothetical protein
MVRAKIAAILLKNPLAGKELVRVILKVPDSRQAKIFHTLYDPVKHQPPEYS